MARVAIIGTGFGGLAAAVRVIALVMQTLDNSIVISGRPGRWGGRLNRRFGGRSLTSRPGPGEPSPTWIPEGHEAVRRIADLIGGDPGGAFTELVDIPMTAHFLGGCVIGATPETGVVDAYHRVHGTPGCPSSTGRRSRRTWASTRP